MSNANNLQEFIIEQIKEYIERAKNKYTCIEDQFYQMDRYPRYAEDGENVFTCDLCNCLLADGCIKECYSCEQIFCDFIHTPNSICDKQHACAEKIMVKIGSNKMMCDQCTSLRRLPILEPTYRVSGRHNR